MSINREMDKEDVDYKKVWNNAIYINMDGQSIIIKWSRSDRKDIPYDITYMWNLKKDIKELIYETGVDFEIKLWLP